MTTNTHDLNLLANTFGPVTDEAKRLVSAVRTWIDHPSHNTKAALRVQMHELNGMWKLVYRMTGYVSFSESPDALNAAQAVAQARDIIEHLNDLQHAKYHNPSLLSSLGL